MKLLFTADIHIKLGQKSVPIDWATNRYYDFFTKLHILERKADLLVLGGDIFDRIPLVEEIELYYDLIAGITIPCKIIPGNHEALKRGTTFLTNLKRSTTRINPLVEIIDDFQTIDGIDYIPYNKLKEYHPGDIDFHSRILVTHVRGEIPPHVKPEVPLSLFDRWDIVLAGDLHSYSNSQRNILYPGSPMTTSFHRAEVETGVILLDTETLSHEWVKLDLPQLLRKTIKVGEPAPTHDFHHIVYEVEGDLSELNGVETDGNIDRKIVRRTSDTSLILEPDLSIPDEVAEYLKYVLALNDKDIEQILSVLNDNIHKAEQ